ncbi:MAG: hypothetical protein M3P27_11185 [Acidobacteriota bacterium]|nr:hypothetical protein [Acidobacteriota bacterium]
MSRIVLGLICGFAFGVIDVLLMLPMSFPDKRTALAGAFCDRFAIGFLACVVVLPWPGWAAGLLVGILISLPSAILTKAYLPIIALGALGGTVAGLIRMKFGT